MFPLAVGQAIGRAKFIPYGVRDRLLRRLWPPFGQLKYSFSMPFEGGRFAGALDNYVDWHVFFFGRYEYGMLEIIAEILHTGRHCFWDVGANCGQHSIFAAVHGAEVHSFEPWPTVLKKLEHNAAINPTARIAVHGFGLSDTDAELPFVASQDANFGSGSFGGSGTYRLPVRRGDDLEITPPTLVKIDVQGFEPNVLRGMQNMLASHRPIVICEDTEVAAQQGLADPASLLPDDYAVFRLAGRPENPRLEPKAPKRIDCDLIFVPAEKLAMLGCFAPKGHPR